MDEISRLASDVQQLTQRVDDVSFRVAAVEIEQKHSENRIADLKALIIEKNADLKEDFSRELKAVAATVTALSVNMTESNRTAGKYVFWFITLVGGAIILALLNLVLKS